MTWDDGMKPTGTALYWSGKTHRFRETKNPKFKGFCTLCAERRGAPQHYDVRRPHPDNPTPYNQGS